MITSEGNVILRGEGILMITGGGALMITRVENSND